MEGLNLEKLFQHIDYSSVEGLYLLHKHLAYSSVKGRKGVCERNSKGDELDNEAGVQVSFKYDTTLLMAHKT